MVNGYRIGAQYQWRSCVRSGIIGDESSLHAGPLIADLDRRARNAGTRRVGHDASDDSAIGSLRQKQTAQAKNSKDNTQPYYEVGSHRSTLPICISPGCKATLRIEV